MAVQFSRQDKARRPKPPLDQAALRSLALFYAGRYATSEAKLAAYLRRKITERGWGEEAEPDIGAVVARLAGLGYVDDLEFARVKAAGLRRKGMGPGRIRTGLHAAGIARETISSLSAMTPEEAVEAAHDFALRKRFARSDDPRERRRQFAAMSRAGHSYDAARAALSRLGADDRTVTG